MASSPDHPELQFIQASGFTSGRPDGPPIWVVVHDMEAHELPETAENTANYFATGAGGRDVSSHYCADSNSVVQCVRVADVAWTVGNRPGNNRGINWELAGFASQSTDEWLDDFGRAMFATMAPVVRSDAARFGIPLVRRTVAELRAYVPGVTSHNDLGLAFGGTDHTDPGPNFPWDYFLAVMNGEDMADYGSLGPPPNEPEYAYAHPDVMLADLHAALVSRKTGWGGADSAAGWSLFTDLAALNTKLDQVLAALAGGVEVSAKVGLTDEAIAAVADATADEIHDDPERDGAGT